MMIENFNTFRGLIFLSIFDTRESPIDRQRD